MNVAEPEDEPEPDADEDENEDGDDDDGRESHADMLAEAENPATSPERLEWLAQVEAKRVPTGEVVEIHTAVARHPSTPQRVLEELGFLYRHSSRRATIAVLFALVENPACPVFALGRIALLDDYELLTAVSACPRTPVDALVAIAARHGPIADALFESQGVFDNVLAELAKNPSTPAELRQTLAARRCVTLE